VRIEENKKKKIVQRIRKILSKQKKIMFSYLHGSFLNEQEFSDIDIGVYLDEKGIQEIEPLEFEICLSLEIEKSIRMPVDVKLLNLAPLSFRYQVSCGYPLFSRVDLKREEFLCKTWSEYFDFQPVAKIYLKEVVSG